MIVLELVLGLAVGAVMGGLGGGGSVLTVPLLVYALDLAPREATTASLLIVGTTAVVGAVGHTRTGTTDWRVGVLLAAAGVPGALVGSHLSGRLSPDALLLSFAAVLLLAAGLTLRSAAPEVPSGGGGTAVRTRARTSATTRLVLAGLGVGLLTGLLGVGGGFVVVPVLVVGLRMPMAPAVGTTLVVVAVNSFVALAARAGSEVFVWHVVVPFAAAAIVGSLVGQRLAGRLTGPALTRAFAGLLVVVAGYVVVRVTAG